MNRTRLTTPGRSPRGQRGLATLSIAMLLVLGMATVALFAHRNLVFEQRTSANQYRAARAFEMAEAGLEWATARLNDPRPSGPDCAAAGTGPTLRERLLRGSVAAGFDPDPQVRIACQAGAGGWACDCPVSGATVAPAAVDGPVFSLRLEPVPEDRFSVRVVSLGCTDAAPPCLPDAPRAEADAQARASVVLKAGPLLRVLPSAALTAAGAVQLDAGVELVSTSTGSTGRLVDAGAAVDVGGASLQTVPGAPVALAVLTDDPALARLQAGGIDAVSRAWFGRDAAALPASTPVRRVEGDDPDGRGARLRQWHDAGHRVFHLTDATRLDGGTLGSPTEPVLLLTRQPLSCAMPPCVVHGWVHGVTGGAALSGSTGLDIRGALSSAGDLAGLSALRVQHEPQTLLALRHHSAALHRVPGSWRDF